MPSLYMHVSDHNRELPELIDVKFICHGSNHERRSVRGKVSGAYYGYFSFQWTRAVQALTLLFIKAKLNEILGLKSEPELLGERGSFAASLDYAIYKRTNWLMDMFGCDSDGRPVFSRMIRRSNGGGKRPGPIAIALNQQYISCQSINIIQHSLVVDDPKKLNDLCSKLQMLEYLEQPVATTA